MTIFVLVTLDVLKSAQCATAIGAVCRYQCMWHCRETGPVALGDGIKDLNLADIWIQSDDIESPAGRVPIEGSAKCQNDIPVFMPDDIRMFAVSLLSLVLWESLPSLAKLSLNYTLMGHQGEWP